MVVYVNTSGQARTWLNLTDPATSRTLTLEPGQEVNLELDLPDPLEDPHLKPKPAKRGKRGKRTTDNHTSPDGEQSEEE